MKVIQLSPEDLRPGDIILSYKEPSKWNFFQKFFDWVLKSKGINKYGKACVFPECNHVRVYIGKDIKTNEHKVFEWTYPKAIKSTLKLWMLSSAYSRLYRYNKSLNNYVRDHIDFVFFDVLLNHDALMSSQNKRNWRKYDWLQLLGMATGLVTIFDLSRWRRVCSTGGRWFLQAAFSILIMKDTPLNKTLPCAFANDSEFSSVNPSIDNILTILPEPKSKEQL